MKRVLHPEELELWRKVAATVRPRPGTVHVPALPDAIRAPKELESSLAPKADPSKPPGAIVSAAAVEAFKPIEPNRKKRLVRERDDLEGRLDLHGLNHDQARSALTAFMQGASKRGHRAVLVITGKGRQGDGILRRFVPDWLGSPPLADLVAGLSPAHRSHGGEGALYVALKRRAPEKPLLSSLPIPR
jgi:DNA-nicking Smr family endonuclease